MTNPSPDYHTTLQNFINLTHASTNDLHVETIALKSFVVNQIYMLKKKSDENQVLSDNKNIALNNSLGDQIAFLKNELRSKDIITKLVIKN